MPWLTKIPPMMSALAFGYGVGMAAPESALDDARAAVDAYQAGAPHHSVAGRGPTGHAYTPHPGLRGNTPPAWGYAYPPPGYYYGYPPPQGQQGQGGPEPEHLARLRKASGAGHEGHSCSIGGPNHSAAPRYVSEADAQSDYFDADELDPAGQEALSRLQLPDFKVAITKSALKYVRFLTRTHRGRDLFASWLKRSGRYSEMIQQQLREWSLPEDLIWVAMIESGFDPKIKSPAGAMGLWQFMRMTGEVYGLEVNRFHDLRKNPQVATRAAVHHLRDLHQRFGSWDLAFAAYNMGYEQLLDRIDRYGTTDFNELARQRALPSETAAYVPKIVAAALVANNLERYGFADIKVYQPVHVSELSVPGGTPLDTIAKASGISTSKLRTLNPHLLTKFVPAGHEYVVYVPPESLSRARAALPAMLGDKRVASEDADVLMPDDLFGLSAEEAKVSRHQGWNEDENLLSMLPKPKRRSMRNILQGRQDPPEEPMGAVAEEFAPKRSDREVVMYRVGPGDTLIGVAKQFAIDIDDLARDNDIDPEDQLREGALLKLLVKDKVLDRWKQKAGTQDAAVARRSKKNEG